MIRYMIRRLLSGLLILFLFVSGVFFAVNLLLPGDFVSYLQLGPELSSELRASLGLDLPLWRQYLQWLQSLLRGELGQSLGAFGTTSGQVTQIIRATLAPTGLLFSLGTGIAFLLGQWLGKVSAWRGKGLFSGLTSFSAIALYTAFPPWLAFLLALAFGGIGAAHTQDLGLAVFRGPTLQRPETMEKMLLTGLIVLLILFLMQTILKRWRNKGLPGGALVLLFTAGWVGSWALNDIFPQALGVMQRMAVPLLAFVFLSFGEILLIMRTTMIDTLHEEYITTAKAKGLKPSQVRDRHAARNAFLPVFSKMAVTLPIMLTGLVMIEHALGWSGLGSSLLLALGSQDGPTVMGIVLTIGAFSLIVRLVLDVLQAALDPRVRSGAQISRRFV